MKNKVYNVIGRVIERKSNHGIPGLRIDAWDKDLIVDDAVGSAVTNKNGSFRITFDESFFHEMFSDREPDLYFNIYSQGELIMSTKDSVLWNIKNQDTDVVIDIEKKPVPSQGKYPQNENYMGQNMIKRAAASRRVDALFKTMSTDFLLREQFVTDPSQIMAEYLQGRRLSPEKAAVSNQMLYSIMSNPGLLRWLRDYSVKVKGRMPPRENFIIDLSRAVIENKAYHVFLALTRSAVERETIYGVEEVLLSVIFRIFGHGGIYGSGTEMSTGTYATEQSGTHTSGGIFESGTEMSTGTYATEQSGTHISGGIFESGTEMSTGTYATEQSGTHISGGIFESGTEMSTGTYATEQSGTHISGGIFESGTEMSTGTYATEQSGTHISGGIFESGTEMSTGTYATEQSGTHISGGIFESGTEMSTGTYATEQSGTHISASHTNWRYILVSLEALSQYAMQLRNIGALDNVYTRY